LPDLGRVITPAGREDPRAIRGGCVPLFRDRGLCFSG